MQLLLYLGFCEISIQSFAVVVRLAHNIVREMPGVSEFQVWPLTSPFVVGRTHDNGKK